MKQSVLPDEIIVVDNGSTDNTKKMIQKEFDNIIYLYHDKKGVSNARNVGIQFATKELICFLDSDDECGWDFRKDKLTDLLGNGIIDPVKVTLSALINAASCAGTLITTNYGIIQTEEK